MPENTPEALAKGEPDQNTTMLGSAPLWRALIHLCIPMIAGLSVSTVYSISNAGVVGALHSTPLLAALTFFLPVQPLIMAIGGLFGVGGGTYISRLLGASERGSDAAARVRQVSAFTVWGSIAAGVVVAALGVTFATPLAAAVGASGESLAPTAALMTAALAFSPALIASFALEQVVRAEGASVVAMTGTIISAVMNLGLDLLFILGFGWGATGVGLAMGLASVAMAGYYAWWISRRGAHMSISPRDIRVDREMLTSVFGVGVSELLTSAFMIVSSLAFNWVAVAYGDALVAAMGLAQRVAQLPEMVCMGVYLGAIPLIVYAFGAGNVERLRRAIVACAVVIGAGSVVFSGVVLVFREPIIAIFSTDPAVTSDGVLVLTAMLIAALFNGITGLVIAVFQATGQMRNATIMAVAQGVLFVPVLLGGNALFGFLGIVWAMTATELLVFALGAVLFLASRRALGGPVARAAATALAVA